ncbi:uncharacterized protein LOC129732247 [Wyeomyia smithii]|uniref:uncharacterized protein LOC129732247 n=1 Tax=Wyeomyia smithii TaxID=174621 RepID=UPI002467DFC7|nr:uncharacterized protein LOC129732247 [Wyeomyia smithii]
MDEHTSFIRERVQQVPVRRRKRNTYSGQEAMKQHSYLFSLKSSGGELVSVCRKFFLNTLGYGDGCGNLIYRAFAVNPDGAVVSKRGKHERDLSERDAVRAHIQYGDTVSDDGAMKRCFLFTKKQMKEINAEGFSLEKNLTYQKAPNGVDPDRKGATLKVIQPVISVEKKLFWYNLPEQKSY